MQIARKPDNEAERLAALRRYMILDTDPEPAFDRITALAARILDVPIAVISLVDEERQWFLSRVGIEDRETSRDVAFCAHAILEEEGLVVRDAAGDPRFSGNPLVLGGPRVRFYAGAPLETSDGFKLGTICGIDQKPRDLTPAQRATLAELAVVAVDLIEARIGYRARLMFEKVAALSPDVLYVFDLERQANVYENREVASVLGYSAEGRTAPLSEIVHPDDLPGVLAHFAEFGAVADGEKVEIVYRVKDARGEYRWFRAGETVFARAADGRPTQILGVATDITALKRSEERLAELAVTDELTGLPNVRALRARLHLLGHEGARGRKFSVIQADVDHFKKVNDTHGHQTGDEVLVAVARALQSGIRATDFVARSGGEEFVVLCPDVDEASAAALAERLRRQVTQSESPVAITASFGVASNHDAGTNDVDALLRSADEALYEAKRRGRDRVVRAHERMSGVA